MAMQMGHGLDDFKMYLKATISAFGSEGCSQKQLSRLFKEDWKGLTLMYFVEHFGYRNELELLRVVSDVLKIETQLDGRIRFLPICDEYTVDVVNLIDKTIADKRNRSNRIGNREFPINMPPIVQPQPINSFNVPSISSEQIFYRSSTKPLKSVSRTDSKTQNSIPKNPNRIPLQNNRRLLKLSEVTAFPSNSNKYTGISVKNVSNPKLSQCLNGSGSRRIFNEIDLECQQTSWIKAAEERLDTSFPLPSDIIIERNEQTQPQIYHSNFKENATNKNEDLSFYQHRELEDDDDLFFSFPSLYENEIYSFSLDLTGLDEINANSDCLVSFQDIGSFLEQVGPIPPNLYRIVRILSGSGSALTVDEIKDRYKKFYNKQLISTEFKLALGAGSSKAKIASAWFEKCPISNLFDFCEQNKISLNKNLSKSIVDANSLISDEVTNTNSERFSTYSTSLTTTADTEALENGSIRSFPRSNVCPQSSHSSFAEGSSNCSSGITPSIDLTFMQKHSRETAPSIKSAEYIIGAESPIEHHKQNTAKDRNSTLVDKHLFLPIGVILTCRLLKYELQKRNDQIPTFFMEFAITKKTQRETLLQILRFDGNLNTRITLVACSENSSLYFRLVEELDAGANANELKVLDSELTAAKCEKLPLLRFFGVFGMEMNYLFNDEYKAQLMGSELDKLMNKNEFELRIQGYDYNVPAPSCYQVTFSDNSVSFPHFLI